MGFLTALCVWYLAALTAVRDLMSSTVYPGRNFRRGASANVYVLVCVVRHGTRSMPLTSDFGVRIARSPTTTTGRQLGEARFGNRVHVVRPIYT